MSDKKGFKIKIIDVIIVLVFASLALVGFKFVSGRKTQSSSDAKITFVVELTAMDESALSAIEIGDNVFESRRGDFYGVVSDVKSEPAKVTTIDSVKGEYVSTTYEDKYDMYVSVEADASSVTEEDIVVAGNVIKVGDRAYIKNDKFAAAGYFVDVALEDGGEVE